MSDLTLRPYMFDDKRALLKKPSSCEACIHSRPHSFYLLQIYHDGDADTLRRVKPPDVYEP